MRRVEIVFRIREAGRIAEKNLDETLELSPTKTESWIRVENKELEITGEGENLTSAVLDYLNNRMSA